MMPKKEGSKAFWVMITLFVLYMGWQVFIR